MTYLRYGPTTERPEPDEQETIDGIIEGMTSRRPSRSASTMRRASHAKSSACVIDELIVPGGLPTELARGLFATPRTHHGHTGMTHQLTAANLLQPGRGHDPVVAGRVIIRDRAKLLELAGDGYGMPEVQYSKLPAPFGKGGDAPTPES